MSDIIDRIRVVLSAAVTWLVFVSVVLTTIAAELPADTPAEVTAWVLRAAGWLAVAIAIIRRVTPVAPADRGIL